MIELDDFEWEVLDREKHDIRGFSSGHEEFDHYLYVDAVLEQAGGLSQTKVFSNGNVVIAYYTARCTKITIDQQEMTEIGANETTVPAIEIPMLAVDKSFRRLGIGGRIVEEFLFGALIISQYAGLRYIFLRAVKKQWLLDFYKRYKFKEIPFEVKDNYTQPMSFKLPTVRELSEEEFEALL